MINTQNSVFVTSKEFQETLRQIGTTIAGDIKKLYAGLNELKNEFLKLREELGHAQNTTAQIVDEDRDLLNTVILHQKYIMEKLGALTPEGEWTEDFKLWCAAKIAEAEAISKAPQEVN